MGKFVRTAGESLKTSKLGLKTVLLVTASCIFAGAAHAEAAPDDTQGTRVEEIVVTALRRDSTLQAAPIAISAVTGETLAKSGIQNISGLRAVPSLTFVDAGPSNTRVVIRGIQSVGEPTVGVYYDEAPVNGTVGASNDSGGSTPLLKLFDVQRVEVLRGPQGTLYGAGSMAGTLRVIFNKPTFNYEGAIDAEASTVKSGGDGYNLQGMVNVPIIADKLAARLVLFTGDSPGYVDNVRLGQKDINEVQSNGGRLLVRFQPTDKLTIDGSAFYQHSDSQQPLWTPSAGRYNSDLHVQLPVQDTLRLYNATARWDLGPVIATLSGSYSERRLNAANGDVTAFIAADINNPAACARFAGGGLPCSPATQTAFNTRVQGLVPNTLYPQQKTETPTLEFRLSSAGSQRLDWTVGAFYSNRLSTVANIETLADPTTGALDRNRLIFERNIKDQLVQSAAFGEASFHVTDQLTLTAGTRYFDYGRHVGGSTPIALDLVGSVVTPFAKVNSKENGWISKFNASYQYNSDIMFYAQASQGFRPGGVNQIVGLPQALTPYDSDSLWDYEGGVKTSWFDHRLTFNIDAYLIDWKDMQVSGKTANGAFSFISNAGAARAKGIEAELTAQPIAGLTIQANAAISSDKLTKNQVSADVLAPGVAGNRIPYTPNNTAGVSGQYVWPVSGGLNGFARLDVNYVGSSYSEFSPTNAFRRKLPDYTLTNARVGIENGPGGWGLYLFVNNLFNQDAITYATASALTLSETLVTSAPPRTIGVNANKRF